MRALTLVEKEKLELIDKPEPEAKDGYVKIKVHKTGICGSDVHLFWKPGLTAGENYVMGHEFSGEVVDPSDSDFEVGDRVAIIDISPCYECEYCTSGREQLCDQMQAEAPGLSIADGGLGEYVVVRKDLLAKLPDNVSYTEAAMVEPFAISYHGAHRANVKEGDNVLVTGGGPIGLFAALSAEILGAKSVTVTEVNDTRKQLLEENDKIDNVLNGLDEDLDAKLDEIAPNGFDVVLEASGHKGAATTGFNHIKKGGTMVVIAVGDLPEMNTDKLLFEETTVLGTIMFTMNEFKEVIEHMGTGRIDIEKYATMIEMEDVQDTIAAIDAGNAEAMKYVVNISGE